MEKIYFELDFALSKVSGIPDNCTFFKSRDFTNIYFIIVGNFFPSL